MQEIDIYAFVLCLIVFVLLTGVFSFFIVTLLKLSVSLIRSGHEDEEIKKERNKPVKKSRLAWIEGTVSIVICALLLFVFGFSVYVNVSSDRYFEDIPTIQVVKSGSMAKKHATNTYLAENDLNDQFSTFDLILTYKIPPADELKKYDIVVYEIDEVLVVHRIIEIEPPNAIHPGEYWFTCKGDAMERIDRFPVKYDQMKGIYKGQRIPFVGSFISFMQSPAGVLCILLILFGIVATPIMEKKLNKTKDERCAVILQEKMKSDASESPSKNFSFAHLSSKTPKTFRQKLRANKSVRTAFNDLKAYIERYDRIKQIESDRFETFKCGKAPIAKFTIRGKTLNVYLALNPIDYAETKYIYTDVSEKSSYKNYPMLVKLTSQRQLRWAKELIDDIAKKHNLKIK